MLSSKNPNALLKSLKNISLSQKSIFPFIIHCDFSLIQLDAAGLATDFETLCKKHANGIIRVDR